MQYFILNKVKIKETEFSNVFERITDAFIALDNSWRYTYLNSRAEELHNRKAHDLIGKSIWEEFPDLLDQPFHQALAKAKETQQSIRVELYYPTTDKWFEDLIYPSANGLSVYYHDITNRKRAELELEKNITKLKNSEEELKLSIERFELVAKATNDAVWDWDIKTNSIWINDNFRAIFNAGPHAIITFEDFIGRIHPEERTGVVSNFNTALSNKNNYLAQEFSFRKSDGTYRNIFDRAYVLYNKDNEPCRILGAMQDITEQKNAQHKLEIETAISDSIINSLPGVFYLSNREKFFRWNKNLELVTGYSNEEIKNIQPINLFPEEEKEILRKKITGVLQKGEDSVETKFLLKNGETIPYYFTAMKILYEGETLLMGVGMDISERMKAEEEIKLSEKKYRLLFNQNPLPMWMISTGDRKFLDVNEAAITFYGYSKEEFLQMTIMDIRSPEEVERLNRADFNTTGITDVGIWDHMKKDGSIVRINIITHDIMYAGKKAKLVLANDVTDKMNAEDNLKKSHEEFRQLATHLEFIRESERTHIAREIHDELGQQLTGLKMDISWIRKKLKTEDPEITRKINETIQLVDTTVKTVRRIATELRPSILDDLGLVAAMEWQSEEFERRFNVKSIFKSNAAHILISNELATAIFRIYQESLTNVLRHAKASRVTTILEIKDDHLKLDISDNGIGFNADEIKNKKTLGLLGMKERTIILGGTYEISSPGGKGTSVIIFVPLN